jgi:hypothetical protein
MMCASLILLKRILLAHLRLVASKFISNADYALVIVVAVL